MLRQNVLEDETGILQYGVEDELEYFSFVTRSPAASAWNKFPTKEEPLTRYKFTSLEIIHSPDYLVTSRQTYSLLDWLGDLGGLLDALRYIGMLFMAPVSSWALRSTLMSKLFLFRASDREEKDVKSRLATRSDDFLGRKFDAKAPTFLRNLSNDFKNLVRIKTINYWKAQFCCRRNYKRMMVKAKSDVNKELDFQKFIYRQRVWTTGLMGLL